MVSSRVAAVVLAGLATLVLTSCQDSADSQDSKTPKTAGERPEQSLLELPGLASVEVPFDDVSGEQDGQSELRLDDDVSESELVTVLMRAPQVIADTDLAGSGGTALYLGDDQVELLLRSADEAAARQHARRALDAHQRLAGLELLVGPTVLGVSTHGDAESVAQLIERVADDPTMSGWEGWKVDGVTAVADSSVVTAGSLTDELARRWRTVYEGVVPAGRANRLVLSDGGWTRTGGTIPTT